MNLTKLAAFPKVTHYVILTEGSVHIPGDMRSQTNPGHGYGPETRDYVQYDWYIEKDKWLKQIEILAKLRIKFEAATVGPCSVETKVVVTVAS